MNIQIRKGNVNDASWLATLCYQQFKVAHDGAMLPEDLDYCVNMLFNEDSMREDIANTDHHYYVAFSDDQPLGCIKTSAVELDLGKNEKNALELTRVYVQPECIGKGVGSALMRHVIEATKQEGFESLWLHVYEKNISAINFYLRWGFEKLGKQDYPVRNSCPVGWVMRKSL